MRFVPRGRGALKIHAENIVVRLVLENGAEGYGEGAPREDMTGETAVGAAGKIVGLYLPGLKKLDPVSFGEAVWAAAGLRVARGGCEVSNAARCAVELALLDAYGNAFKAGLDALRDVLPGIGGQGGSPAAPRVAVIPVLGRVRSWAAFRFFRVLGFRSFKLMFGPAGDKRSWDIAAALGRSARRGRLSLCADARGSWTAEEAPILIARLKRLGFSAVEQPVAAGSLAGFSLSPSRVGEVEITADESLRTPGEAERLASGRACDSFLVGLSKCGGLFPSLQVVAVAGRHGLRCHLGAAECETGILAAAQGFFLGIAPGLASVAPSLSRLHLKRNIVRRTPGPGGLAGPWPRRGCGLGVIVDRKQLQALADKLYEIDLAPSGAIAPDAADRPGGGP